MDLPLGILALPMLVSTAAATSTWLRVRRRRRTFAAVSSLVREAPLPEVDADDDPVIEPPLAVGPVRLPTPIAWSDPTEPIARLPRARTPRGSRPPSYEPLDRADTAPNAPEAIEDDDTAPVLLRF